MGCDLNKNKLKSGCAQFTIRWKLKINYKKKICNNSKFLKLEYWKFPELKPWNLKETFLNDHISYFLIDKLNVTSRLICLSFNKVYNDRWKFRTICIKILYDISRYIVIKTFHHQWHCHISLWAFDFLHAGPRKHGSLKIKILFLQMGYTELLKFETKVSRLVTHNKVRV